MTEVEDRESKYLESICNKRKRIFYALAKASKSKIFPKPIIDQIISEHLIWLIIICSIDICNLSINAWFFENIDIICVRIEVESMVIFYCWAERWALQYQLKNIIFQMAYIK